MNALHRAIVYQIRQRDAIDVSAYGIVEPLPKRQGSAQIRTRAVNLTVRKASNRRHIALSGSQYIARRYINSILSKLISAISAAHAFKQTSFIQRRNYLLQILKGNLLALGDIVQRNRRIPTLHGDIEHKTQGIAPLC